MPRQCGTVSRLISGCSGHSYAASKTTAVFLHGTSLSRHTSSFKARSPGQPSTAQSRKVSRSLTALTAFALALLRSPDPSKLAEDGADVNPAHDTSPKCPLQNRHMIQCSNENTAVQTCSIFPALQ